VIAEFHTEVVEMKKSVVGVNTQDTSITGVLGSDQVSYVPITKTEASYKLQLVIFKKDKLMLCYF